jgi:hypothetical protein
MDAGPTPIFKRMAEPALQEYPCFYEGAVILLYTMHEGLNCRSREMKVGGRQIPTCIRSIRSERVGLLFVIISVTFE